MNRPDITCKPDCPTFADLSAWMDGDGRADVGDHVSTCRACDKTVKFYRKVDQAIVSAMAPSPDLAARITAACEQERGSVLLRFWPTGLWRIAAAAALVIAATLSAYIYFVRPNPVLLQVTATGERSLAGAPVEHTAPVYVAGSVQVGAVPQVDDYVWDNEGEEWVPRGSVRASDLTMATAGVADTAGSERGVREMAEAVRHVWVVGDAQKTDRVIRSSLPAELAAQLGALPASRPVTLRMVIKDRDLQGFVDKLSTAGFSLVSPELPQPGEARRILAVGKSVMYEAELVPPAAAPR